MYYNVDVDNGKLSAIISLDSLGAQLSDARGRKIMYNRGLLYDFGESWLSAAYDLVPVDTGALQGSLDYYVSDSTIYLSASMDYAAYVEYGTSKQSAQPYFEPAIDIALLDTGIAESIRDTDSRVNDRDSVISNVMNQESLEGAINTLNHGASSLQSTGYATAYNRAISTLMLGIERKQAFESQILNAVMSQGGGFIMALLSAAISSAIIGLVSGIIQIVVDLFSQEPNPNEFM